MERHLTKPSEKSYKQTEDRLVRSSSSHFSMNKNSFQSSLQLIKNDFHSCASLGVAKGVRKDKQQKRTLTNNISNATGSIDTDEFGIRITVIKTKE